MKFQYQSEFDSLELKECPPNNYKAQNIEQVFRWVFDDMDDSRNFQPQYHKNPKRFWGKTPEMICSSLALSMFDSAENAEIRFYELRELLQQKVYGILGTKIAVGKLTKQDGLNSKLDEKGHFNHHPVVEGAYNQRFKIIKNL
jgi:hypothetical protein